MDRGKKKPSRPNEVSKQRPPLGLVIVLAAAGGAVIGSAGTYFLTKPQPAPVQSASSVGGTPTQASAVPLLSATPAVPPPPQQFTPAPQPPGEAPPGKVWSPEHGHWHDVPLTIPVPTPGTTPAPTPGTTPTPAPPTVTPTPPPAVPPAAAPGEKKEG